MKNLIYSAFALFIVLLAASCQKDAAVSPSTTVKPQDSLITVSMINNSSTPYEVSFQGATKYTADIQANSRQTATVKVGAYDIEVYPLGGTGYAAPHTIAWGNLAPINSPRANLNVVIPLASSQSLLIY